jgi:hypothetical protein
VIAIAKHGRLKLSIAIKTKAFARSSPLVSEVEQIVQAEPISFGTNSS